MEGIDNSLPRLIAEKIATDIFNGKLEQGERIIEDRYAELFGSSRAPVREALYLLAIDGLIERKPRKGAFVKQYTQRDIRDLYEIRLMLEMMAIDRIQYPISEPDRKKIERILKEMENTLEEESYERYTSLNSQFHFQLIVLSKSEVFKILYRRLGSPLIVLQKLSFYTVQNIKESLDDHRVIWQLLQSGKRTAAQTVLKEHHDEALNRLDKILKEKKHILK
ncbi:DNA-binding GntR family transcriptional regulator [Caldalkalibacillus uzonensis]|uniref:DNA-binding GntR family transcriptional regulator n=1 Tax=Caldalkalibacillus uzonensis TaxID=353224 RepID=A0ABU0CRS0_9BACI|nr:GntR family transcriptional regulator [Caldalkalibacillus uzonensis]MDQ0338205.1 DNA-binding GntR family transcriptional regulator [Caldalkalibacillus uzonensis]